VRTKRFLNNLHQVHSQDLKVVGIKKNKELKQDSQYQLMSLMSEGGEPLLYFIITLFRNCIFR